MKKFAGFAAMSVLAFTVVGCSDSMSPAAPSSMQSVTEEARGGMPNENSRAAKPTIVGIATSPENIGTFSTFPPFRAARRHKASGSRLGISRNGPRFHSVIWQDLLINLRTLTRG